jgi:maltose alpha-D-glucosyltransferase/alpha-amylase
MHSKKQPSWLRDAIIYEVYPQSFRDTNGDGIGDLPGVIEKLDYIASLGCNTIWLNPCFESPFKDAGYDVSDFCQIAPRYGTQDDIVRLFKEAHRRGIKVVLDLVAGHTSDQHPWFQASSRHERNSYSDYYVWTPTVWHSPEGIPVIRGVSERNAGYVPNFFAFQPALNYGYADPSPEHPWQQPPTAPGPQAVRRELLAIMEFWLVLGCDGFRVDMASSLIKGTGEKKTAAMRVFWQEIRAWFDSAWPEAVLISEWSKPSDALAAGFHVDFLIHFESPAYNSLFRAEHGFGEPVPGRRSFFSTDGGGDISIFLETYEKEYAATRDLGYISLPTGNHDLVPRLAEGRSEDELRVALAFLFTMPGLPIIYQGDEIGMRFVHDLPSKEGGFERTGLRSPMQWNGAAGVGFSDAPEASFYLPLDPDPDRPTVSEQEGRANSLIHFVRMLTRLRKEHPALGADGKYHTVHFEARKCPYVYERSLNGARFLIAINPAATPTQVEIKNSPSATINMILGQHSRVEANTGRITIHLDGAGFAIFKTDGQP